MVIWVVQSLDVRSDAIFDEQPGMTGLHVTNDQPFGRAGDRQAVDPQIVGGSGSGRNGRECPSSGE